MCSGGQTLLQSVMGSYSREHLVGFDVTLHANSMEEACTVADIYWHRVNMYSPLMGHVDQFNLDIDPIILLEITGAQPLKELMEANH